MNIFITVEHALRSRTNGLIIKLDEKDILQSIRTKNTVSIQTTKNLRLSKDYNSARYIANDARFGKSQPEHSNPKIRYAYLRLQNDSNLSRAAQIPYTDATRARARARARSSMNAEQKHKALTPRRRVGGRRYCFSFTFAVTRERDGYEIIQAAAARDR